MMVQTIPGSNSLLLRSNSLFLRKKFPVPLSREFCFKFAKSLGEWRLMSRDLAQN